MHCGKIMNNILRESRPRPSLKLGQPAIRKIPEITYFEWIRPNEYDAIMTIRISKMTDIVPILLRSPPMKSLMRFTFSNKPLSNRNLL